MIVIETIKINDKEYKKTYSDSGYLIRKIGTDEIYDEAIDLINSDDEYEETTMLINEEDTTEEDYLKALEELGVE